MTNFESDFAGEAQLEYGLSDFMILSPGAFVTCAVTGEPIPLSDLRYWSHERQEAYRDAAASLQRWLETQGQTA